MKKCYFITEKRYIDKESAEGGVKLCTLEFLHLLEKEYDVEIINVSFRRDIPFRLTVKLGIDAYNLYSAADFLKELNKLHIKEPVLFAFNMTQTMNLTKVAKDKFGDLAKVIMLSHGNESGDFLHNFTRFTSSQPFIARLTSSYKLGELLKKEARLKKDYIDLVLTVSGVEEAIDKWQNAKHTMLIPRVVFPDFIKPHPVKGKIGFIGDMSHYPNYHAIELLANQLMEKQIDVDLVVIGSGGQSLQNKYPFIRCLGFLEDDTLRTEVSSWALFLNLAFYYSRGVSTKLGKALSLGLPIVSTAIGTRGYRWKEGKLLIGESPTEIADIIKENAFDDIKINNAINQTELIANSTPTYSDILKELKPLINSL